MLANTSLLVLYAAALASACPLIRRDVDKLDEAAFEEAQQRDDTATRAFSDVQIKTSDGKCLFVTELSGDFRANLTPVQIGDCGSTDGQGWDIITAGLHNDQDGQVAIVSTLTQACLNVDPRRAAGDQVNLFSCGGRADGGGEVTNSQLFAFDGATELSLTPQSEQGQQCLTGSGQRVDRANCDDGAADQSFTIGDGAGGDGGAGGDTPAASTTADAPAITSSPPSMGDEDGNMPVATSAAADVTSADPQTTAAPAAGAPTGNPDTPVPVSRAGGTLDPEAAAEAHVFDSTATRALQSVNVRAADGRCLSIDPTAGDFRQNLIPVALAECSEEAGQKFDVVTKGVHNDGQAGDALLVSSLTNGCISFDGRRAVGDTVTLFSCGGRAGGGKCLISDTRVLGRCVNLTCRG